MSDNFCAAPWAGLSLDPDGMAKICCISKDRVKLKEFNEIQRNPKFIEIRKAFIDDQQHPSCTACWQREKTNSTEWESRRSIYQPNDFYHNLDSEVDARLEHLDLRWSNTCNLNCVYCSSVFSSKWASLLGQKEQFRIFPKVTDSDLANLKILQLAGGEPLLIKENLEILQRLLKINPTVAIEITTNLTMINNNQIYNILKKFANVTFVISFEATDQRFEYIRHGAKWSQFKENLNTVSSDFTNLQVNMVYFPLSSMNIIDTMHVALEYTSPKDIFLVSQFGGHGFDMLSKAAVQYINQYNLTHLKSLPNILQTRLQDQLKLTFTNKTQTILPLYDQFDQLTNQAHKEIFKELYQ